MQLVRWLCVAEDHNQWSIEKLRTVDFDLICKGIARELSAVSFQVKNVEA